MSSKSVFFRNLPSHRQWRYGAGRAARDQGSLGPRHSRPRGKRRCLLDDRLADHRPPNRGLAPSCKEGRAQQEEQMKQSVLVGLSVLALAACTPQPSPQMGAGTQPIIPAAYAAGSPGNTTSGFDGTYIGGTIQNISQGKELDVAGGNAPKYCPSWNCAACDHPQWSGTVPGSQFIHLPGVCNAARASKDGQRQGSNN